MADDAEAMPAADAEPQPTEKLARDLLGPQQPRSAPGNPAPPHRPLAEASLRARRERRPGPRLGCNRLL